MCEIHTGRALTHDNAHERDSAQKVRGRLGLNFQECFVEMLGVEQLIQNLVVIWVSFIYNVHMPLVCQLLQQPES
jgi:hypothetical protein